MCIRDSYCGLTFTEFPTGEKIDQFIYIKNKLSVPSLKDVHHLKPDDMLPLAEAKVYATCVGRLIWVLPTQIKYQYSIAYLARYRQHCRVKHLHRIAEVISKIRDSPGSVWLPRMPEHAPIRLLVIVDAGQAEQADPPLKPRDYQGICVLLASPMPGKDSLQPGDEAMVGILSWTSNGCARVSHSLSLIHI